MECFLFDFDAFSFEKRKYFKTRNKRLVFCWGEGVRFLGKPPADRAARRGMQFEEGGKLP